MNPELEYVLGTADAEIRRLGMQHAVWRSDANARLESRWISPGKHDGQVDL